LVGVSEYKEIAQALVRVGVLDRGSGALLRKLAGYRNRLVHFYQSLWPGAVRNLYPAVG
jgi:uncharacterized protein YutE (UPF0331/DUF86 family)